MSQKDKKNVRKEVHSGVDRGGGKFPQNIPNDYN